MALSRVIKTGDGVTRQFVVDFALGYLDPSDVTCRVGVEVDGTGNPIYRTITFLSETLMQISGTAPGAGVRVVFERTVEKEDTIVHFSDGDVMDEINLDLSFKQILMVVHEVLDGRFGQFDSDLDLGGFLIHNLGDPVVAGDAANKRYVDGLITTGTASAAAAAASAAAAAGSAAVAAGSQTAAGTSATNAGNSATAAAASATAADTSATNASNSATAAQTARTGAETARTGAETARTGAETANGTAQTAAGTATTKAGEASTSATNAANSATAAVTSATIAGTARDQAVAARSLLAGGLTGQLLGKSSNADYAYQWVTLTGGGDMLRSMYDPTNKSADAFAWANFTGIPTVFPTNVANISDLKSNAKRDLTVSTSVPSGGVDGDVWYKI